MPGYLGSPIIYKGNLYFQYQSFSYSGPGGPGIIYQAYQLAKFDGNGITLINNPDNGPGIVGNPIIYKGKLCFQYQNANLSYQLAVYNDTSISLIPNINFSDQGMDSYSSPFILNGNLYFGYVNGYFGSKVSSLGKFDGNNLSLLAIPSGYEYNGNPILYKNDIYVSLNSGNNYNLTKFDGLNFTIYPNNNFGGYIPFGASCVFNDTLYYFCNSSGYPLAKFDSTNISQVTLQGSQNGFQLFQYNNNLYFIDSNKLTKLNHSSLFSIPDPILDSLNVGLGGGTIYNNKLYFWQSRYKYQPGGDTYNQLLEYDGKTESYIPSQIVGSVMTVNMLNINGVLYFGYTDSLNYSYLASYISNNQILGQVISPIYKGINKVEISTIGTTITNTQTNSLGGYSFSLSNGNYTITPTKNNDINKTNGITTLDMALVQSHILGKNKLNNPYKIIAADVNGDGKATTLDIVYMKRLILGLDTTFTNTTNGQKRLWAFVDSSYSFPDTTNPFPFKDSISYVGLSANKTNQTFIGVKLGDVNWDWNPLIAKMPSPVFIKPKKLIKE